MRALITTLLIIISINSYIACQDRLIILFDVNEEEYKLQAIIRDFSTSHPDFETFSHYNESLNLVKEDLGPDDKPVFNSIIGSNQTSPVLTSEADFNQWYNTIPGINYEYAIEIELIDDTFGMFQYINTRFFPLKEGERNEKFI